MEFNYGECDCITPCSELYYRKTVYYTEMHNNFRQKTANLLKKFPDIALASVRISLPESQEYQVKGFKIRFLKHALSMSNKPTMQFHNFYPMLVGQWD